MADIKEARPIGERLESSEDELEGDAVLTAEREGPPAVMSPVAVVVWAASEPTGLTARVSLTGNSSAFENGMPFTLTVHGKLTRKVENVSPSPVFAATASSALVTRARMMLDWAAT